MYDIYISLILGKIHYLIDPLNKRLTNSSFRFNSIINVPTNFPRRADTNYICLITGKYLYPSFTKKSGILRCKSYFKLILYHFDSSNCSDDKSKKYVISKNSETINSSNY
jgi:hypothetical protein